MRGTNLSDTKSCHEATEADTGKTEYNPGMMQSVVEHQEVPKGDASVIPVARLGKRRRDRNLAAERLQKSQERTRGFCVSRKRVAVAGRRMFRCAVVTWLRRGVFIKDYSSTTA